MRDNRGGNESGYSISGDEQTAEIEQGRFDCLLLKRVIPPNLFTATRGPHHRRTHDHVRLMNEEERACMTILETRFPCPL